MSGGVITVALGVFERLSGKAVPLGVYVGILGFFAVLACYLAWRHASKELANFSDTGAHNRHFRAERLNALLREAGDVEFGMVSLDTIEGMGKMFRQTEYHKRAKSFLNEHYGSEIAARYDKEKTGLLERLLAECYKGADEIH